MSDIIKNHKCEVRNCKNIYKYAADAETHGTDDILFVCEEHKDYLKPQRGSGGFNKLSTECHMFSCDFCRVKIGAIRSTARFFQLYNEIYMEEAEQTKMCCLNCYNDRKKSSEPEI